MVDFLPNMMEDSSVPNCIRQLFAIRQRYNYNNHVKEEMGIKLIYILKDLYKVQQLSPFDIATSFLQCHFDLQNHSHFLFRSKP